ncbi:uncharacterized protein BT62DRAFT_669251 [Guyanagaster necrorhizus]|uniref:Uncharacterized protein n=1 Tax=Guyanagaster necrorhizus TaxID=856835 RepID=A0A9P7VYD8_9AGAR|nr:uncharacterized protein BT62DRAFT_669251 [Guyanagaster necrorhizus MCA 3950]KAG7449192.1 hypothetical protein BT62DRAFT_669251 [Guyanagaster necrorhizus MCA 3950]
MPSLFRGNPVRSTSALVTTLAVGWMITKLLSSLHAFHLTQTSVAMMAIASLMLLVMLHHRREGWRAFTHGSVSPGQAGAMGATSSHREAGFTGGALPYPCSADDIYCVVEEWSFF